ncbi:hypothetical protein CSUB01_07945 [Colletotrichum sublineola]|uniref:Uncharacterized protein n=1 Tax=Colletotrichum sublineola TaxID=1173701 RepID=A0A066XWZ9_COLSU|nr:hypothetical protein CSUB01_07945 [Colletotrichum sublineola]
MAQSSSSKWSSSSGHTAHLREKRHEFVTNLQGAVSTLLSWYFSVWSGFTQKLKQKSIEEKRGSEVDTHNQPNGISLSEAPLRKVHIMDKPLPVSPLSATQESVPQAPPPLVQRRYLRDRSAPFGSTQRPISWSENQILALEDENRDLRHQIISQKRIDDDKDHIIAMLRQHNCQVNLELSRQTEALTKLASMAMANQSSGHLPINRASSHRSESLDHSAVDEVIQIYSRL